MEWVVLKESKKKDKYVDLAREHESDGDNNCNWCTLVESPKDR